MFETTTPGYTFLNANLGYNFRVGPAFVNAYLRGTNLTNEEARNHLSFLKEVFPLPDAACSSEYGRRSRRRAAQGRTPALLEGTRGSNVVARTGRLRQGQPHVRPLLSHSNATKPRALVAAISLCAIAIAILLSAASQWHDWLHKSGDRSTHECAATLMSSGSAEHSACEPVLKQPQHAPAVRAFRAQPFARVLSVLGFSLLEHAPPAQVVTHWSWPRTLSGQRRTRVPIRR